jgi:phosphoribosylformylglycinamidine (FGAM) synthase PurS component
MPATKTCFVIMPFGEKTDSGGAQINFDDIYEFLIKPPLERLQIKVVRCDEIPSPGSVHRMMLQHILHDDLAIVDITTLNPNVFYELGVRHALRRSATILLRKTGTKNPFNIRGMKTFDYDLDMRSVARAQATLQQAIEHALANPANDSLVYEVFPGLKVTASET